MRFPKRKLIRAVEDYHVDRTEVEAQQCVELTDTNRPRACFLQRCYASTVRFPRYGRESPNTHRDRCVWLG